MAANNNKVVKIQRNKQVTFEFEGKKYTLEYDRNSVRVMELQGLNVLDLMRRPMSDMSLLFEGAFIKHHPEVSGETVWAIYNSLKDKGALNKALIAMCQEVFYAMIAEPDEKNAVTWTVV